MEGGKGMKRTYLFDRRGLLSDVFLEDTHALKASGIAGLGASVIQRGVALAGREGGKEEGREGGGRKEGREQMNGDRMSE